MGRRKKNAEVKIKLVDNKTKINVLNKVDGLEKEVESAQEERDFENFAGNMAPVVLGGEGEQARASEANGRNTFAEERSVPQFNYAQAVKEEESRYSEANRAPPSATLREINPLEQRNVGDDRLQRARGINAVAGMEQDREDYQFKIKDVTVEKRKRDIF